MRFTKMQGAGNDYVYVDCFAEPMPSRSGGAGPADRRSAFRRRRRWADPDLPLRSGRRPDADVQRRRLRIGDVRQRRPLRGQVRVRPRHRPQADAAKSKPARGVLTLELEIANERVHRVRVDMGPPILEMERIPIKLPDVPPNRADCRFSRARDVQDGRRNTGRRIRQRAMAREARLAAGLTTDAKKLLIASDLKMTGVSMGNPHLVMYHPAVANVSVATLGPILETHPFFPKRINVHFVQVDGRQEVTMRTWERGSGITLACGTGACAVCVAGVLTGRTDRRILAHLPGGDLELEWRRPTNTST